MKTRTPLLMKFRRASVAGIALTAMSLPATAFAGKLIKSDVTAFKALDATTVYALDSNQRLWRMLLASATQAASTTLVDSNVAAFSPINASTVYVLGTDGNLWNETGTMATRTPVDSAVAKFQGVDASNVYVEGTDENLWLETGDKSHRIPIDGQVGAFRAITTGVGDVLENDGLLWQEAPDLDHGIEIDGNVAQFKAAPGYPYVTYVLSNDTTLWNETGNYHHRFEVDGSVLSFEPVDFANVYVQGFDGNLWLETDEFTNRVLYGQGGFRDFQAIGQEVLFTLSNTGTLELVSGPARGGPQPPRPASPVPPQPATLPYSRTINCGYLGPDSNGVGGYALLGLSSTGDWSFTGHAHDNGFFGMDYAWGVTVDATNDNGQQFGTAATGTLEGTENNLLGTPRRDSDFTNSGYDPSIAANWEQITSANWQCNLESQGDAWLITTGTLADLGLVTVAAGAVLFGGYAATHGDGCGFGMTVGPGDNNVGAEFQCHAP